jgi:predicted nucleic acid-binding protein
VELVDTNVVSELMRPSPNRGVLAWSAQNRRFAFSVVSLEEIQFGLAVRPSARIARQFRWLLDSFAEVLPVTDPIAQRSAELRAALHRRGQVRHQADMLIAATAYEHGAVLLTRNVKDFSGCGLRVHNPFTSV